jgi:hypothetical protein
LGFCPFPCSPPQEKESRGSVEKEGGAGKGGHVRHAAGAPRPEASPVAERKEGEVVRVGEEAGPE